MFDRDAALEKVAGGFGFLEGPVWEHRGGFLYVSDETLNKISRVYPDGRTETILEIGDPDGSTLDRNRRLITTASVLRAIIEVQPDGKYRVLADKYDGKRFNAPMTSFLVQTARSISPIPLSTCRRASSRRFLFRASTVSAAMAPSGY